MKIITKKDIAERKILENVRSDSGRGFSRPVPLEDCAS